MNKSKTSISNIFVFKEWKRNFTFEAQKERFNKLKNHLRLLEKEAREAKLSLIDRTDTEKSGDFWINPQAPKLQQYLYKQATATYFHSLIENYSDILPFLSDNKITIDAIIAFNIGYAPNHDILLDMMETEDQVQEALKLGLFFTALKPSGTWSYQDGYKKQLIFPILNKNKDIQNLAGKMMLPYGYFTYSRTVDVYKKKPSLSNLYGVPQAKEAIKEKNEVIVVDTPLDVVTLWGAGFKNVIGIMGTEINNKQTKEILKLNQNIILGFSRTGEGGKKTERLIDKIRKQAPLPSIGFVEWPDYHSPTETLKQYGEKRVEKDIYIAINDPIVLSL